MPERASRLSVARLLAAFLGALVLPRAVAAHELRWPTGMARVVAIGHCAKGPCRKRASFAASVPHRHVAPKVCAGLGAGGIPQGRRFAC